MDRIKFDWFFHTMFALLGASSHMILGSISENVPYPYMDEIFHVPQVQAFCNGNFTQWDPMITTLPGLYLFTVGLWKPISAVLVTNICGSLYFLRYINILFTLATFYVTSLISHHKLQQAFNEPKDKDYSPYESSKLIERISTIEGLLISTFPILFFFTFLYYTDQGSVFFILLSYLFQLKSCHKLSAIFGAGSILFRQTNVVWVVFIGFSAALPTISGCNHSKNKRDEDELLSAFQTNVASIFKHILQLNFSPLFKFMCDILKIVWPYLLVVTSFIYFVISNGGITVGAKEDHQACIHATQVLYFSAFSFAFLLPHISIFKHLTTFLTWIRNHVLLFVFLLLTTIVTIHYTTHAHRYLLSDNRHYTFYLWKNIFQRHWSVKHLLSPIYMFTIFSLWLTIKPGNPLWKLAFISCLSLVLIPAQLIELRYFITPFILLRLNTPHHRHDTFLVNRLFLELILYTLVNTLALLVFINKPFISPSSSDVQRFMY